MTLHSAPLNRRRNLCVRLFAVVVVTMCGFSSTFSQSNPPKSTDCRVEAIDYKGWHAQQLSNRWVQLIFVPQNGGGAVESTFPGKVLPFFNHQFAGKNI